MSAFVRQCSGFDWKSILFRNINKTA